MTIIKTLDSQAEVNSYRLPFWAKGTHNKKS